MNTATTRRFLILLSSKWETKRVGLYQLVSLAEHCYNVNDIETLKEFSILLQNFSYPFHQVGRYYQAICSFRRGELEKATNLLESVAETGPDRYRAKALLSLGAVEQDKGDLTSSLKFRLEACHLADPATFLEAQAGIAVIRSIEDDHPEATKHLEKLMPLARAVGSSIAGLKYYNSLAFEFGEVGRIQEASNVSRIVLASPYAFAYPEWRETGEGIAVKSYRLSRSMVSVALKPVPLNVLLMPDREIIPTLQDKPAGLRSLQEWKDKMVKEPNGDQDNDKSVDEMNDKELIVEIMQLTSQPDLSESDLRDILKYAKKVISKTKGKK